MIKFFTAFTEEIDEVDLAVSDLLGQLDLEHNRLTNSLGIIHCYSDFVDSGVVKALSEKLPFDTVGSTTMSVSTASGMSQMGLTVTVLTSDDVQFISGVSGPVTDSVDAPLTELYNRITAGLSEKPAMLMPFVPFLFNVGGDEFVEKLDALSGGIPAFGTLAISSEQDFSRSYTICNGESYLASMALTVLVGNAAPEFLSVSVNAENVLKQKAVITGVNRNIVQTINNMPAIKYIESIGLVKGNDVMGLQAMPFIIYLEDGSMLVRACINGTEDGGLILCGAVPVNSTVALATMGFEDVVNSTEKKVTEAQAAAKGRGILMYSCAGRNWALGMQPLAEHEKVKECLKDTPYHFVYSAGEIFPSQISGSRVVNHLQNDSLIICIL
ncbi:FIST C-terminal domain-containing protein [Treponema sp. TIM-1]|uniref:FIST N-terminal domain-containing protein n=1 Tax=Treponema sp. TIM-1 TaxID=2898417 RepID=UPI00397F3AC3